MTYIRAGLCVRPCSPMRIYVWAYATVRIGLCHRTYRLMPPYVLWMLQKDLCVFKKARYVFKKLQHLFKKARCVFNVRAACLLSQSCSFLLVPSSLHFKFNTQTNNRLKMTVHPLILPSAALSKSLHNLPSAISFLTNEGRLKGRQQDAHSPPEPLSAGRFNG